MSNNEKYVCVNCVEQISKKDAEIAALLKQWNDLDQRNEVRHREWNTKLTEKDAEIERLQADNERLRVAAVLRSIFHKTDRRHQKGGVWR